VSRHTAGVFGYLKDFAFLTVHVCYSSLLFRGITYEFLIHESSNPMEYPTKYYLFVLHTNEILKLFPILLHQIKNKKKERTKEFR